MNDCGWRLYLLLALFDRRDGSAISDFVRSAREGYERSDPEMGPEENADAWSEFDHLWNSYSSQERLALVDQYSAQRSNAAPSPGALAASERTC